MAFVWLLPFVDFCGSIRALLWIAHPIQFGYTSPIRAATETSRECLVFVCHSMFQDWHDSLFDTISLVPKRCTLVTCFPAIVKNDKALLVVIFAELFQGPVTGAMYQSKFWVIDNSSNALRPTWNVKLVDPIVRSTIMEGYPLNQQVPPEQWVRYGYNSPTDTISKEQRARSHDHHADESAWEWEDVDALTWMSYGYIGQCSKRLRLTQARSFWPSKAGRSRSLDDMPRASHQSILARLWNFPRSWNSQPNNRMEDLALNLSFISYL